jgi:hypothetical protein
MFAKTFELRHPHFTCIISDPALSSPRRVIQIISWAQAFSLGGANSKVFARALGLAS